MFSLTLQLAGSLLHGYVAQRLSRSSALRAPVPARIWWLSATLLWLLYLAGAASAGESHDWRWWPEQFALAWLGLVATLGVTLLMRDLATCGGRWWRAHSQRLLGLACALGLGLYACAVIQGLRAPTVSTLELRLPGLPPALDGTVLVMASDLQLGAQRDLGWLSARVTQINALQPDLVVLVGDLVEHGAPGAPQLVPVLRRLQAPRGVWAVTGNHEFYTALRPTLNAFSAAGVHWLRDQRVSLAPGLQLAGVEDVAATFDAGGDTTRGLRAALPTPASGATILLAHTPAPALVAAAAAHGVDLMLSGHTHGGQIWPFGYLLQRRYPYLQGHYQHAAMHLFVSRGAGTSGPRMRLWQAGELVRITLRSAR